MLGGRVIDFRHRRGKGVNVAYLASNIQTVVASGNMLKVAEDVPERPFPTFHFVRDD